MDNFYKKWKKFLKEYKVPNEVYHGSAKKFNSFDSTKSNYRGLTYFTTNINFAKSFASGRGLGKGIIYKVQLPSDIKIFDITEEGNVQKLTQIIAELVKERYKDPVTGLDYSPENKTIALNGETIKNPSDDQMVQHFVWRLQNKSWRMLEGERVLKFIESLGYDGLVTKEGNNDNVGIFASKTDRIKILSIDEIDVDPD